MDQEEALKKQLALLQQRNADQGEVTAAIAAVQKTLQELATKKTTAEATYRAELEAELARMKEAPAR